MGWKRENTIAICLIGFILLSGCTSTDSCGGAGTPVNELKSYCKNINFNTITLNEKNGQYILDGIERLELAGFTKTSLLASTDYRCDLVGDAQNPDSYIECSAPVATVIMSKNPNSSNADQIIIWYMTFDPTTKKIKEVDCWCDQKGQGFL